MNRPDERGIALIAALMVMLLMSALMIGFTTIVMSDQRFRGIDKDRTRAFYGAQSGLEKLTVDLGNLFLTNVAPTNAQIAALSNIPPVIPDVAFVAPQGVTAYGVTQVPCNPQGQMNCNGQIQTGSYQGLMALKKRYALDVVAKTAAGGEAHLKRTLESVAIPVFQFGMFSDVDLSFFAGPNFNFGGRVHTNGNLFLAEGQGSTLTLTDKVTAVKEVVRQRLQNGVTIDASPHTGTINMATGTNSFRPLLRTEGSVTDGLAPVSTNSNWHTISLSTYNGYIRNGATGAKPLNLALITIGGANTDLVRRPVVNENNTDPVLFGERLFTKASVRILLSDTAADITNLPTVTAVAPVQLDGDWRAAPPNNGAAYGPVDGTHPAIARSPGLVSVNVANINAGPTIAVAAVPNYYKPSNTTNGVLTVNAMGWSPTCTGRTASSFTACAGVAAAIPNNTLITGVVNGVPVTTTTNGVTAGGAVTINVAANGAVPFAPDTFWMTDANGVSNERLVTCTTVTLATWTNCSALPGAAGAGSRISTNALVGANTPRIGGFLKIELQDMAGAWRDVTMEILNWGFADRNQQGGCADPTPNAILRLQRLQDIAAGPCTPATMLSQYDFWPDTLFDTREALLRDTVPGNTNLSLGGLIHYVSLDVANLSRWLAGTGVYGGGNGVNAFSNNGYGVYFSDRRNNRNTANKETGEYGFEDIVNPLIGNGAPNGVLDPGEDLNANGLLDNYGRNPSWGGVQNALPPAGLNVFAPANVANVSPATTLTMAQSMTNPAVMFRHALKLVNGGLGNIAMPGLTIVAENPVYVQGNWNANAAGWGDPHAETAVIADAVTLLSNEWTDYNAFQNPYNPNNRARATQTWYRLAIIGGKGPAFAQPAGTANDFGTDGGAHNFLRYLESGQTVNYRGSIATFFYNRQATGTYKCCTTVYAAPVRNYAFDLDFLNPATLPPLTPVFRDLNALGFSQEMRPGK